MSTLFRLFLALATLVLLPSIGCAEAAAQVYDEPNIVAADTSALISQPIEPLEPVVMLTDTLVLVNGETVRLIPSVHVGALGHSPHTATIWGWLSRYATTCSTTPRAASSANPP